MHICRASDISFSTFKIKKHTLYLDEWLLYAITLMNIVSENETRAQNDLFEWILIEIT